MRTKILVLALFVRCLSATAEDFSTTNSHKLARFWELVETKQRPVRVLSFGDSVADSYRSPTYNFFEHLLAKFGAAGYSFHTYHNTLGINLTNVSGLTEPNEYWFNRHFTLPPDAAVWWEREWVPGGNRCDYVGLAYVAYPQGGTMALSVSTNAGPWADKLTLDCYSPTPVGRFTNVWLAPNLYRLRAQSLTGTNIVIAPMVEMTATNGIHFAFMDYGGLPLSAVTNVPRAIRDPIMAALKPDLLVWHMKENGPWLSLSNCLEECENWWHDVNPEGEVLYIGTYYTCFDTNSTLDVDQNRTVRGVAVARQRAYVDLMQPNVSYPWQVAQGFMADEVHMNQAGGKWCGNVMWDDLGMFALGLPRSLSARSAPTGIQVSFATGAGAIYNLQTSADLVSWSTVLSVPGNGLTITNTLPPGISFMRLNLRPLP